MTNLPAPFDGDVMSGKRAWLDKMKDDGTISTEQVEAVVEFFEKSQASPMQQSILCEDLGCPYLKACPLYRNKIPRPTGKPCPIEETFKEMWYTRLAEEIGVHPDGYAAVDLGIAVDIVNTMIDIHRAQSELVNQPAIAERVVKGQDRQGNDIVDLKMNPVIFSLKSSRKQKAELLNIEVATREARAKDKSRQSQDAAQLLAKLREGVEGVMELKRTEAPVLPGAVHEHLSDHSKEIGIEPITDAPDLDGFEAEHSE
ncbi:MAG: hypothetical protein GTO63_13575 [Anaerolineae bacterium]|nr:hypothetical protein [Anaerolineae bacterium]NIN95880.1 hypothetical protein [Anaerolineae bacterium]NIQ78852.1 hypothetical protein [Anaerolineae bacterium]